MRTIKISELPLYQSLKGLFTIGTDSNNRSVKVPLEDLGGGGGGSSVDVVDNLNSTDGTKALSAKQGKVLDEKIAGKQSALTFDNAPTSGSNNLVKSGGIYTALQTLLSNITVGQNGNWYVGETDTGVKAQGPKGNSVVDGDTFEIVNNLIDGGEVDALSADMGILLKNNINAVQNNIMRLYTKLGNMAFWTAQDKASAAPTALDWQVPQVTVTLDKTGLSANAMITDASDQEITGTSVSVDQGSGLTLKIKPRPGCVITAASATIGGVSQTLTKSGGIYTLAIANVTSAITIVFSVTADAIPETFSISYNLTNCAQATGETNPTQVIEGGNATIKLECSSGYELTLADIVVTGATKGTLTESNGVYTLTITNATGNVTVTATAAAKLIKFLAGYRLTDYNTIDNSTYAPDGTDITNLFSVSELAILPAPSEPVSAISNFAAYWGKAITASTRPVAIALYDVSNGIVDLCKYGFKGGTAQQGTITSQSYAENKTAADVISAYNAGNLAARVTICRGGTNDEPGDLLHTTTYGFKFCEFIWKPISGDNANYKFVTDATDFLTSIYRF